MKKGSTLFLRVVILLIGLIVLALCMFLLPVGIMSDNTGGYRPILLGMYLPAIPFFVALYHSFKLLGYIDHNQTFSLQSVNSLKAIKYSAFIISFLYALGMPYIFYMAQLDDAPGVAMLGFIFIFGSLAAGTAAAVFQKLFQNALDIKSENDLTV